MPYAGGEGDRLRGAPRRRLRRKFSGCLGWGSAAQARVGPDVVVVVAPVGQDAPGMSQGREQGLVQAFVPQAVVEALHEGVLGRLARRDLVPADLPLLGPSQHGMAGEFRATVADTHPRLAAPFDNDVQLPQTLAPESEVSATKQRLSRLKSSATARTRNPRPSLRASLTKSKDQRWFGPCGSAVGARVPSARFRPRRRRTASPSSR